MRKALVIPLCLAVLCTACSTAWVSTLDSILAAAAPALINILQIAAVANGQPLNSGLEAKIDGDASAIKTLAGDFAEASAASAPGACQQLQAAVSDPNTQTKIMLLTNLVAGTVDAITAVIPSCENAAVFRSTKSKSTKITAPYSVATFAAHYNSILVAKTGNVAIDAMTPKMKLRQHSKLVRMVTFGRLQ